MLNPEVRTSVEAEVRQLVKQTGRDLWWLLLTFKIRSVT